jgi:hypothetical protein
MFRRVFVMFSSIILIGAIWAVCPVNNNPLVSAAQAQAATDYPASFTGSLVERSSDRVAIKRTVYVGAYSSVRLGRGTGKVELANHVEYSQHLQREGVEHRPRRVLRHGGQSRP